MQTMEGGCHCGRVRFRVTADLDGVTICNCSVCTKISPIGAVVKPDSFKLLTDESKLGTYVWGGRVSTRYFCKECGVHSFARGHLEQLGGDYVSVNLNCLDDIDVRDVDLVFWDGRHNNWQGGPRKEPWPSA